MFTFVISLLRSLKEFLCVCTPFLHPHDSTLFAQKQTLCPFYIEEGPHAMVVPVPLVGPLVEAKDGSLQVNGKLHRPSDISFYLLVIRGKRAKCVNGLSSQSDMVTAMHKLHGLRTTNYVRAASVADAAWSKLCFVNGVINRTRR